MRLQELDAADGPASPDPALCPVVSDLHRIRADHRAGARRRRPRRLGRGPHLSGIEPRDARGRLGVLPRARRGRDRQGYARGQGDHFRECRSQQGRGDGAAHRDRDAGGSSAPEDRPRGSPAAADAVQQLDAGRDQGGGRAAARRRLSHLQDQSGKGSSRRSCARAHDPARDRRPRHHADRCQPRVFGRRRMQLCLVARSVGHRAVRAALRGRGLGRQRARRKCLHGSRHAGRADLRAGGRRSGRRPFRMSVSASSS